MHDALGQVQAQSPIDRLAAAFAVAPAEAAAAMRVLMPEFAWHLQTMTLSRGGLADLVETLGGDHRAAYLTAGTDWRNEAARRTGEAILARLLGTKDASRMLAARAARQCGLEAKTIAAMLPHLVVIAIGGLALRARSGLAAILAQVPPLGRLSRGGPHADLAGILRRRCGAGAYSPRALPRAVRRALAAGGFPGRNVIVWYLGFMAGRRAVRVLRNLVLWLGHPAVPAAGR